MAPRFQFRTQTGGFAGSDAFNCYINGEGDCTVSLSDDPQGDNSLWPQKNTGRISIVQYLNKATKEFLAVNLDADDPDKAICTVASDTRCNTWWFVESAEGAKDRLTLRSKVTMDEPAPSKWYNCYLSVVPFDQPYAEGTIYLSADKTNDQNLDVATWLRVDK